MKITERNCKQIVGGAAVAALLLSGVHLPGAAWKEVKADTVSVNAKITKELSIKETGSLSSLHYPMEVLRQSRIRCRFTIKRKVSGKKLIRHL